MGTFRIPILMTSSRSFAIRVRKAKYFESLI
jgi:hypothetical protein